MERFGIQKIISVLEAEFVSARENLAIAQEAYDDAVPAAEGAQTLIDDAVAKLEAYTTAISLSDEAAQDANEEQGLPIQRLQEVNVNFTVENELDFEEVKLFL